MLTVTSDNQFLRNPHLAEHDHAFYLNTLIGVPDAGAVWLLFDTEAPSLAMQIWQRLPQIVLATAALLMLVIWQMLVRFGPLIPDPDGRRRDIVEHFLAIAHYYLRTGNAAGLPEKTRETVLRRLQRRFPVLAGMQPRAAADWLAAHLDLDAAAIQAALFGDSDEESAIIAQSQIIQQLMLQRQPHDASG